MPFRQKIVKGKYRKVCSLTKKEFIYRVMVLKLSIRQASEQLCINYSTAKSIIRLYKTDHLRVKGPLEQESNFPRKFYQKGKEFQSRTSLYRDYCPPKSQTVETEPSQQSREQDSQNIRELLVRNQLWIRSNNVTVVSGQLDLFHRS